MKMLGWIENEEGQGSLEWILVIVLIVITILFAISTAGINDEMGVIADSVTDWINDARSVTPGP